MDFSTHEDRRRARSQRVPPHRRGSASYPGQSCFCTQCEAWYIARLRPGDLVMPVADVDDRSTRVGIGAWGLNERVRTNSSWRFNVLGTYIGPVPSGHRMDYIGGGFFLIQGLGLRVARRTRVISLL